MSERPYPDTPYRVPASESIGRTFGTWKVLGIAPRKYGTTMLRCVCKCGCGTESDVRMSYLRTGKDLGPHMKRTVKPGLGSGRNPSGHVRRDGSGQAVADVPLPTVWNSVTILDLIERRRGFR